MLKFFVVALLVCKASSFVLLDPGHNSESPEATDDPPTTDDCVHGFSDVSSTPIYGKLIKDDGYIEIKGLGAYKLHSNKLPWNEANEVCKTEGGNLVIIRTIFEAMKVTEILEKDRKGIFWIGIHQVRENDARNPTWRTSLDENLTYDFAPSNLNRSGTFSRLVFGPVNIDNNQCGLLYSNILAEISAPCIFPAPFICKREPMTMTY